MTDQISYTRRPSKLAKNKQELEYTDQDIQLEILHNLQSLSANVRFMAIVLALWIIVSIIGFFLGI